MNEYENTEQTSHRVPADTSVPMGNASDSCCFEQPFAPPEYHDVPQTQKKSGSKRQWVMVLVVALCCLMSGAMGAAGVLLMQHFQSQAEGKPEGVQSQNVSYVIQGLRESSVIERVEVSTGIQMTPAEVYAANVNSTVGITTSVSTNYWGFQSTSAASGSGFIISDDGYILTNFHVIEDSDSISVSMYNGDTYDATLSAMTKAMISRF